MPSSPDSGPTRMFTFTLSTRRRASETATSGVASEHPKYRLTGRPAIVAPDTPAWAPVPSDLPPASLTSAYLAPEKASFSNRANEPPHVARTPILIALALVELPAAALFAAVVGPGAELELELLEPHPVTASAASAATARSARPPPGNTRHHFRLCISTTSP